MRSVLYISSLEFLIALVGTVKIRIYLSDDEAEIKKWWITSVKKLLGVPLTG